MPAFQSQIFKFNQNVKIRNVPCLLEPGLVLWFQKLKKSLCSIVIIRKNSKFILPRFWGNIKRKYEENLHFLQSFQNDHIWKQKMLIVHSPIVLICISRYLLFFSGSR